MARLDAPLLEREHELAALRDLIVQATAGTGGVALVEGPAGIGKSSLLDQTLVAAAEAGHQTASGRGSELERSFAFGLVRQLYEPLLRRAGPTQRERLFEGAAGLAGPLLTQLDATTLNPVGEASQAALHGLYWLTVNLATDRPLTLVVDDVQWVDAPSLRFVAYLAIRIAETPVFIALGSRPFEPDADADVVDEIAAHPSTQLLRPEPLGSHAVEDLVHRALRPDADPTFVAACLEASGGNPLLLSELLTTLSAEGIDPIPGEAQRVLDTAPASVGRSVTRRLRRLPPEATALAQAVAVLNSGTDLATAARLADLDIATAVTAADTLARADLLDATKLEFVHPVVRAAIYAELTASERARQHREAAAVLAEQGADEDQVACHVLAVPASADPWAVEVLRRAARRAHTRGAPDVAVTYLERALAELRDPQERVDMLVELAEAGMAARGPAGVAPMREALELADDPHRRAVIALKLATSLYRWGRVVEAATILEQAREELGGEDSELAQQLEAFLLSTHLAQPPLSDAAMHHFVDLFVRRDQLSDPVALATLGTGVTLTVWPAALGAELVERAVADRRVSIEDDAAVVMPAAIALMSADRLEQAREVWDRAIDDARRRGSIEGLVVASIFRAFVSVRLGDLAAAEADVRLGLERARAAGASSAQGRTFAAAPLIDVLLERDELEQASRLVDEYRLEQDVPGFQVAYLLDGIGRLRIAQHRIDDGIAHLRECGRRIECWTVTNPGLVPWRSSLAPTLAGTGARDEALSLAHEEIELARAYEVPRELGMALRAAGLVEGGDSGIQLLEESVSVLEHTPARLEHARALTHLGAALRRSGRRTQARHPLRVGLDLAQRCGATALTKHAHDELMATGARPRRLSFTGIDALTASERRVAEMAADGMTNREVAQALFVTEKTVEGHLSQAYRKLDISSRSQLPAALVRARDPAPA